MDADTIEITGETKFEKLHPERTYDRNALRTLVRMGNRDFWLPPRPLHTLCMIAKKRADGEPGWIEREDMISMVHTFNPVDIYRHIHGLRQTFGPAIVECARRRRLFRLGIEKDRIVIDPALSEHPDGRIRALFCP